jgi:polyphosphate kinase
LSTENSLPGERFFNRELAELAFINRVLELAQDASEPLFERLQFLTISSAVLDEFYKIRVAALRGAILKAGSGKKTKKNGGWAPREELAHVDADADALMARQHLCWLDLRKGLAGAGFAITSPETLNGANAVWLKDYFASEVIGALEPLVVGASDAFPFVPDNKIFLALGLRDEKTGEHVHGMLALPAGIDRFAQVPGGTTEDGVQFVLLEDILGAFLPEIFVGYEVVEHGLCHILREGNLKLDEEMSDLLHDIEEAVERRRSADVIRLKVSQECSNRIASWVAHGCGLIGADQWDGSAADDDIIASEFVALDGLLGLGDVIELVNSLGDTAPDHLHYERRIPRCPPDLRGGSDLFAAIRAQDRLLHFPFDDFGCILALLNQAADDPDVVSIKQTLYRSGLKSKIVEILKRAAANGKAVTVVMELEARDDEEANIHLAHELEAEGVQVVFGFLDMKVHVKVFMISRSEADGLRTYVNFATGNYHVGNAGRYTDLSLLSDDEDLAEDAAGLFNYLTGTAQPQAWKKISVAPHTLRETVLEGIANEVVHAKAGRPAEIWGKLNKLTDKPLIDALYQASNVGVRIRLLVRGACLLKPGLPGLSENIEVRSIVGRFLEHSRLICFGNGASLSGDSAKDQAKVYLSSADWMPHKLNNRVEVLVPLRGPALKQQILGEIFKAYWRDETNTWLLDRSGTYVRGSGRDGFSVQTYWLET